MSDIDFSEPKLEEDFEAGQEYSNEVRLLVEIIFSGTREKDWEYFLSSTFDHHWGLLPPGLENVVAYRILSKIPKEYHKKINCLEAFL